MLVAKALAQIAPRILIGEAWNHPILPSLDKEFERARAYDDDG